MNHFKTLLGGELKRLIKYKIALVGIIVSLLWVATIALLDSNTAPQTGSMLVFTDAGMMSVLLLIAAMYFEKQEGTLRTTMVTPSNKDEIMVAKMVSAVILGLISAITVGLSVFLIHAQPVNFLLLIPAIIVIVLFNSMIAFVITIFSKNFNNMLVNYMIFVFVLILPSMLISLGVFGDIGTVGNWLLMLSPIQACQTLIDSAFVNVDVGFVVFGFIYCLIATALLYFLVVRKHFKKYAIGD